MKKLNFLMVLFLFGFVSAQFTSPGTGVSYNLQSLSAAAPSVLVNNGTDFTMKANIIISAGDSLVMNENTTLKIDGGIQLTVAGTYLSKMDSLVVTASVPTSQFRGILFDSGSFAEVKNTTFEYGGGIRVSTGDFVMDSCTVRYFNSGLVTGSAISVSTGKPVVKNSTFISNVNPVISSGANQSVALLFENNYVYKNNTTNNNRPQINMGPSGGADSTVIRGNIIIGDRSFNRVGGISVSSLLGGANSFIVEDNIVKDNRYGFTSAGGNATGEINNNIFEYNDTETTPSQGGSGISLTNTGVVKIRGNQIRNSLWGITLIGTAQANLGTEAENGNNIFKDNGNGGVTYALYNNTANPVSAIGNCWREGELSTEAMVAEVVWDNADFSNLGVVDYTSFLCAETLAVSTTNQIKSNIYPNPNRGSFVLETENAGKYSISDFSGRTIVIGNLNKGKNQLAHQLTPGTYIVTVSAEDKKGTSQKIIVQ